MAFRLTAVILLLVVSFYNAQADKPACNIILSGSGTYLTMKPYGNKTWKALGNDGRYLDKTLKPGSNGNFHLFNGTDEHAIHFRPAGWDDAAKCLKDGSVAYNSATHQLWPMLYVNPVKILMTPPFPGIMVKDYHDIPGKLGHHWDLGSCLNAALAYRFNNGTKPATGVTWWYRSTTQNCWAYDTEFENLFVADSKYVDASDDKSGVHFRSMIFKPLPLMGSTLERHYAGSYVDNIDDCELLAKKMSNVVKIVNLSKRGDCYYSKDNATLDPSDQSDYWVHKVVDYVATQDEAPTMSCTFV